MASSSSPSPEYDRGLIALCTRRPVAMAMMVFTVLVFGLLSFFQLPRNLMPDISYPTVTVRTKFPGAAPVDVEDRVSERLESVLAQVRNLKRVSSISRAELSEIILEFSWDTDMGQATMEVREKVDQAVLPDEVERPTILRYDPTLDPIIQLGFFRVPDAATPPLTGEERTAELIDLRIRAEELIEKELEFISGVAAVDVRGGYEKEIRVDVDEDALTAKEISMDLVVNRIAEENQNLASGVLYHGDQSFIVRAVNEFEDLDEIRNIVLTRTGEVPIRLAEVATVTMGFKDPEVLTRYDGAPCIKIDVFKEADANVVEVAQRVRDRIYGTEEERQRLIEMEENAAALLAEKAGKDGAQKGEGDSNKNDNEKNKKEKAGSDGAKSDKSKESGKDGKGKHGKGGWQGSPRKPSYLTTRLRDREEVVVMSDQSVFISRSLDEVRWTAVLGGFLAIFVLYVFLRRLWFTGIVGLAIPLSVISTFAFMKLFDVSLNIMSLGGLALGVGMLVDNSIVVLESIFRFREEGHAPREAAVRGARSVASAVTASTLTTVAVFFPIVFVEGIAGQVFRDQAIVVVVSLLASLAVSTTFIPTLVSRQLQGTVEPTDGWFAPKVSNFNRKYFATHLAAFRWSPSMVWRIPVAVLMMLVGVPGWVLERIGVGLWRLLRLVAVLFGGLFSLVGRVSGRASGGLLGFFDRGWRRIEGMYPRVLAAALRNRAVVLLIAIVCGGGAGMLISNMGSELIPEVHQGEFTVEVALPVGTRIERTDAVIRPLELQIRELPAVASLATTIGVEEDSSKAGEEGEHTARLLVQAKKNAPPEVVERRLKQAIREILAREPEVNSLHIRNPVLFSFKTPIEVEIKGYNLKKLGTVARQIEDAMLRIDSLKDVKLSLRPGYPEIHVKPRRDVLVRHDLNLLEIGSTVRRKVKGDIATRFSERDRKVDIRVRLREGDRSSLGDLRSLVVNSSEDAKIPLDYVGQIFESEGPAEIRRIGQSRAAVVTANLAELDLGRATNSIADAVEALEIPADISVEFGGQQTEMDRSRQSLIRALLLAVFLVYVVMAAQFESLVQPFVILFSIPLAGIGIGPVLYGLGEPLSVIVFIGMIILAGIVVNNAIVLIDCINQLRRSGMAKMDANARAGQLRLRPIFMTTATTVLGLLPLTGALNHVPGIGPVFSEWFGVGEGLEIRAPMAITVIAGLVSSTFLTLIVIPVVYSFSDRRQ